MIDIPTEEEILAMMVEIRENPQELRFVAQRENGATPISELHHILHKLLSYEAVPKGVLFFLGLLHENANI